MKKRMILYLLLIIISITGGSQLFRSFQDARGQAAGTQTEKHNSSFEVHYIDVGQADAALVLCDGEAMLIDGGNRADSSLIYAYLKQRGIEQLDYMVCTHPHEDHVGGLAGALNYASAEVVYAPVTEHDSDVFRNFTKYLAKQDAAITVPAAGDTFSLGSAEVTVVGPTGAETGTKLNNTSIVLRLVYGNTSFLFTGDAEREEEQAILEAGYEIQSTVLKVGHHGGAASTTYPFLREIAPEYAVISVGEGNSYGHPTEDVLSRLRDADVLVYRTDMQGTVVCISDGEQVSFQTGRQGGAGMTLQETEPPQGKAEGDGAEEADYILNTKSRKFHNPTCQSVYDMNESNKEYFTGSRDDLVQQEYTPCGRCEP